MKHQIFKNMYASRKLMLVFGLALAYKIQIYDQNHLKLHVFGIDGNGGSILDIHTYLTDQEMASLRFQKRLSWHGFKQEKDSFKNVSNRINDEELKDLGIDFPQDRYVEYNKRPPHDFYL